MVCQACFAPAPGPLCKPCRAGLRPAPERILPGGVRLITAYEHNGTAARLVHGLKYRGLTWYADLVADVLASLAPRIPVVPVPRSLSRLVKYGVDPAREISQRIARINDVPMIDLLRRPLHSPSRAGGDHRVSVVPLRAKMVTEGPVVVVDDVLTTGATLLSAVAAVGSRHVMAVMAANDASGRSTLAPDAF